MALNFDANSSAGFDTSTGYNSKEHEFYETNPRAARLALDVESKSREPLECACEENYAFAKRYFKHHIHHDTDHKDEAPSTSSCQGMIDGWSFGPAVGSPGLVTSENAGFDSIKAAVTFDSWFDATAILGKWD